MDYYDHALRIDSASSAQRIALAADLLNNCEAVVLLNDSVALRPSPSEIVCEVIDPGTWQQRSSDDYRAMVAEAASILRNSALFHLLAPKSLRWLVVDNYGMGIGVLWPPN